MNFPQPHRFRIGTWWPAAVAGAVFSVVAVWMVVPAPPPGFYWDDTWYLMMAEWLSRRGETQELAWSMLQLRQYPPLFPFAISLSGASLDDTQPAYLMNAVFLAIAGGVAMFWFHLERCSTWTMILGAALVLFNPVALHWLPALFSEHLYILLTTTALALACARRDWVPLWLLIGIVAGLSIATRTTGWALAAALVLHLLLRRRLLLLIFFATGTAIGLLMIPYLLVGLPSAKGYLDQLGELPYEPDAAFLLQQTRAIATGWVALWGSVPGALIAFLVAAPGLWFRIRQNRPDAWYLPAYLAILLAWPYPDHMSRFLWPLAPALLVAAHAGLERLGSLTGRLSWSAAIFAVVLAFSIPDGLGRTLIRLAAPPGGDLAALSRMPEWTRSADRQIGLEVLRARQQLLQDMQRIAATTYPGYCIYSELSALIAAQARRVAKASPWNDLDEVDAADLDCLYYYLVPPGLPGTTREQVDRFGTIHDELFRSTITNAAGSDEVLGAFFNLKPPRKTPDDF